VLADYVDALALREALIGVMGNGGIERGVSDGDTCRSRNHPSPERQVARNIVQVRIPGICVSAAPLRVTISASAAT
jgi:hypothetical protein